MAYDTLASKETIEAVIPKLKERNIEAEFVETKDAALARIKELIPKGASVMSGSSTTLNEIGFTEFMKSGSHGWNNLKDAIVAEQDPAKQATLRKDASSADYFLGSVHAVAETGQLVIASASGSQLPGYAFMSPNIIWVVGTQKIMPDLESAMNRVREYVLPLEDARMKSVNMGGSVISKWLIYEREPGFSKRKLRVIFVNEKLGF